MNRKLLQSLFAVLLFGVLGSQATAQTSVAKIGAKDTVYVALGNKGAGNESSTLVPDIKVQVGPLNAIGKQVVLNFPSSRFRFSADSVTVAKTLTSTLTFTASTVIGGKTQAGPTIATGSTNTITLQVETASNQALDTLTLSGSYVVPVADGGGGTLYTAANDSFATANQEELNVKLLDNDQTTVLANANFREYRKLPGTFYQVAVTTPSSLDSVSTSKYTVGIDVPDTLQIFLQDRYGNRTFDETTNPTVGAYQASSPSTPANGTLSGTAYTRTIAGDKFSNPSGTSHGGRVTIKSFTYTKAEQIRLKFVSLGNDALSKLIPITFRNGVAANITVAISSGSDTLTVDQTTTYLLTVTDQFFNPVPSVTVAAVEQTSHGGGFSISYVGGGGNTNATGQANVVFTPSKAYVSADTLVFTSGAATQKRTNVFIKPGALGGVLLTRAFTASGSATTEAPGAAGSQFIRAFFRDTYGNPIDATDISQVSFAVTSLLAPNGSLNLSGTVVTSSITNSNYPNTIKTAKAIAIPYTVSTKAVKTDSITATTAVGSYTGLISFANRSQVPATTKLFASGDSSLVASNFANSVTLTDSAYDQYGNLVTAPGSSVTGAPTRSSYQIRIASKGIGKFVRAADTTTADTLYHTSGAFTRTISSGKTTGIDTVAATVTANTAVSASVVVYVTPAAYARLELKPDTVSTVAGATAILTAEKRDAFANHIDWGLNGGESRGVGGTTKPTAGAIATDSTNTTTSLSSNRGNAASNLTKFKVTGTAGVASVGGSLLLQINYATFTTAGDTAKVGAVLSALGDTSVVYSATTGALASFAIITVDTATGGTKGAGDSLHVTFEARDPNANRIYTYQALGWRLTLSGDTTGGAPQNYWFRYYDKTGKFVRVKVPSTLTVFTSDSLFSNGRAVIQLESQKASAGGLAFTLTDTAKGVSKTTLLVKFNPGAVSQYNVAPDSLVYHLSQAPSTANPFKFRYSVNPQDQFKNINSTEQHFVNIAINQGAGVDIGTNPKAILGSQRFDVTVTNQPSQKLVLFLNDINFPSISSKSDSILISSPVKVEVEKPGIPTEYALSQNYPNPFNPTTTISFDLPKQSSLILEIYNILGQKVRTLVNGEVLEAGYYKITWDGTDSKGATVGSGVYFYRVVADKFTSIKRMMLLK